MKKLIIVSTLLCSFLFVPIFVSAQIAQTTTTSTTTPTPTSNPNPTPTPITNASLNTNLYYGLQNNSDVKQLQEFLIAKGFLTGSSTGNFFSLTLKAVKVYQTSVSISPTGYVGTLTRTAINNDLAAQLSASNAEAIAETGTTPPASTTPATANNTMASLQTQIAALQQQIASMQQQNTTTQTNNSTQPQTLQQITQNLQALTGVPGTNICTPNWQCSNWSACTGLQQTRTCTDLNNCNTTNGKPLLTQISPLCSPVITPTPTPTPTPNPACTPNWQCGGFGNCVNAQQSRTCTDANNCGTTINEPPLTQSCNIPYITIGKTSITADDASASTYGISINFTVNDSNVWSEIEFSTNSDFSSPMLSMISNECVKGDNEGGRAKLAPNTTYYYRFIGGDDCTWNSIANQNNLANNFTYSSEAESFTTYAPTCTPNWKCSGFGPCVNGQQTQTCTDNDCSITSGEPALMQSCTQ